MKTMCWGPPTLKWVPCQTKLADNVSWDVCLDALALFGMTLCSLQEMVELFRVKLLPDRNVKHLVILIWILKNILQAEVRPRELLNNLPDIQGVEQAWQWRSESASPGPWWRSPLHSLIVQLTELQWQNTLEVAINMHASIKAMIRNNLKWKNTQGGKVC